ncbi:GntP family permease [Sediminicola sp. 1XM1-17]|uniref:GntP family permease n=1 Tax=Sediminicola sp. 1XM1-17 TaxID=3127702 RepID=UPI0030778780
MNVFLVLFLVIIFIIVATIKLKIHPLFSLIIAALMAGGMLGMEAEVILETIAEGFGKTLSSIGLIIAFGTVIGIFLEKTNGTRVMANTILKWVGLKRSPLAMNITGFVVSIPVFCDSGFIILSSLNKALSKKSGLSLVVFAVALATGLYASHVFVPPTPGPLAAAAVLEADLGLVMLLGLSVAIPVSLTGFLWANYIGRRLISANDEIEPKGGSVSDVEESEFTVSTSAAFLPLLVPIILIALKSILEYPGFEFGRGWFMDTIAFIGNPTIALLIGVVFAFNMGRKASLKLRYDWVVSALKEAGLIVMITGAGGAFGSVLRAMDIAGYIPIDDDMIFGGILVAFFIAAVLKTAQGSSTVAIITTAAIMAPLLGSLGLETSISKACTVLAIGAGAMTVSHVNDSYFWVVSQFSNMDVKTALKSQTTATFFQGITGLVLVLGIHYFFG